MMTKSVAYVLFALAMLPPAFSWTMDSITPGKILKAATTAFVSATLFIGPQVVTSAAANALDFTGSYSDPKHPNCLRNIVVSPTAGSTTTTQAQVSGTDGTPGCPPDGSGRPWR
jgi:hypothetical protein